MAELVTFAAQEMLTRVASLAGQELKLLSGFSGEVTKLRESLLLLQAMLRDAEHRRQDQGEAVKVWLKKLEVIVHCADDLLDDYGYELLRRKVELQNQMKKKVLDFFSLSNPILFRVKMAHKIKRINSSLDELEKMASAIGLVNIKPTSDATTSNDVSRETYPSFNMDESKIIGRKDVVSDIVKVLTTSSNKNENALSVMAIVGMAGLGKTTLAKSVYHDDMINKHFHEKLWVCVSTPFEVKVILRGILEFLKPDSAAVQSIGAMCRILKESLKEKRYLLVLDDVWNEDAQKWDTLVNCLLGVTDSQESRIIVTTRSDKVAKLVETLPRHDLRKLSNDECWDILRDRAVLFKSDHMPEDQERIGREIAKMCGGVPLVAKVLGNVLRSKTIAGWKSIVENEIWDFPEEEERIMKILKLSFDELESPMLKQCFAYCSMFIKDFQMEKDDLVQLWMAQGWLHPSPTESNLEMEDIGNKYFSILLEKSLFQDIVRDTHGDITGCKMHDLIHDLAERTRVSNAIDTHSVFLKEVSENNLHSCKSLRVLNLYEANIDKLPISIGKLRHLRYLNVMGTNVKAFPTSIGRLLYLQTFKMPYHFEEFPREIANLINLRHICFGKFVKVPAGILGRLTNLRSLPFLRVSEERGSSIKELGGLIQLRGTLSILSLEHVRDGDEAETAKLAEKNDIRKLTLEWKLSRPSSNVENEESVLERLRPHSNLEFLKIKGFMGAKFPSWLLLSNNLKEIELLGCNKCEEVPALGHLPNLRHIKIKTMPNLRCLGSEFYGYDYISNVATTSEKTMVLFPALKTLHIEEAENLVEWMGAEVLAVERLRVFPCLEELTLKWCNQLRSAPSHFPCLKKLVIAGVDCSVPIINILSNELTTLTYLHISSVHRLACLPEGLLESNKNLAYLEIEGCEELTCIAPHGVQNCCESLRSLRIWECNNLRYLPDGLRPLSLEDLHICSCNRLESISILDSGLPSLRELSVQFCNRLSSLPMGLECCTSLERLSIRCSSGITSIPIARGLPLLREFAAEYCSELSSIPSGLGCCTSLEDLTIIGCHKITSIPVDSFTTLHKLCVSNLECLPTLHGFTSLRQLTIQDSKSTQIEAEFGACLHILVPLQHLDISSCDQLESIPSLEKLTSLCSLGISCCSQLRCLPSGLAIDSPLCLTSLKRLHLGPFWNELDTFPAIQVIPQLEELHIFGWPKLKSLPEQIQHLTTLKELSIFDFDGMEAIPEWLGKLASLELLYIRSCKNLMYLPSIEAMQRLTRLNTLYSQECPLLRERCMEETGPEWPKICQIPYIEIPEDT